MGDPHAQARSAVIAGADVGTNIHGGSALYQSGTKRLLSDGNRQRGYYKWHGLGAMSLVLVNHRFLFFFSAGEERTVTSVRVYMGTYYFWICGSSIMRYTVSGSG